MEDVNIVGVDLAKQVFQIHGATKDGTVLFRKKLSRLQFAKFMGKLPQCIVAMEACATAHYWGREMKKHGHDVRLIPPVYVKPFVKRNKNDAADAEAIVEAAQRPNMRTVEVKTPEQQSRAMLFRTRELLVSQRTQKVNALRAHLAEHGYSVPRGIGNIDKLAVILSDVESDLPNLVREVGAIYIEEILWTTRQIEQLQLKISKEAKQSPIVQRLQGMPGIGPICAMAVEAFAPSMNCFHRGRDFSVGWDLCPNNILRVVNKD